MCVYVYVCVSVCVYVLHQGATCVSVWCVSVRCNVGYDAHSGLECCIRRDTLGEHTRVGEQRPRGNLCEGMHLLRHMCVALSTQAQASV